MKWKHELGINWKHTDEFPSLNNNFSTIFLICSILNGENLLLSLQFEQFGILYFDANNAVACIFLSLYNFLLLWTFWPSRNIWNLNVYFHKLSRLSPPHHETGSFFNSICGHPRLWIVCGVRGVFGYCAIGLTPPPAHLRLFPLADQSDEVIRFIFKAAENLKKIQSQ